MNATKVAQYLFGPCFAVALLFFGACGAPETGEMSSEEDSGAYLETSTASVVMEYEASCAWLKACANPSGATACGNLCDDSTPFVATPVRSSNDSVADKSFMQEDGEDLPEVRSSEVRERANVGQVLLRAMGGQCCRDEGIGSVSWRRCSLYRTRVLRQRQRDDYILMVFRRTFPGQDRHLERTGACS